MIRIRTGFSFRTASGAIPDVMARLKEVGYGWAPITDRASTFGWTKWKKAAEKAGLRPVFGVELAVTNSINAKKPAMDFWTFIAEDSITPINKLVELATTQFRYQPLLTYQQALSADCFKIIGHRSLLDEFLAYDGTIDNRTFFALSPSSVRGYVNRIHALGIPPIACSDNKYPVASDRGLWEIICGRNAETQSYAQHILTVEELREATKFAADQTLFDEALANAATVALRSTATLRKAELLRPEKPQTLRAMCEAGAADLGCDLSDPVYSARVDRELQLIAEKQFEDYFYIVADICEFARANMLVGPARGSSCGSLVCYLLKITTVDPIPFGLIFERFIDINRNDLPDIDIDFSDQRRHLVFEYVARKYGGDRIARLGTVALFKPRSALQEAGTALKIPKWKCDAVAESLIERSSGDSRALNTLEDTLSALPAGRRLLSDHPEVKIIERMEGHPRHYSQHAAGIIIAEHPISEYVAVDHRTGSTMCDKKDAEDLDLLKIDALGLIQLSVFEDALEMAGLPRDHLYHIDMNDPDAFRVLNQRRFSGIFQFNGIALQSIVRRFTVDSLNDIVSVTALARPGPMSSGGAEEWIIRRNGTHSVTYPHPVFEPFLRDTLGIVIYQEQVMEVGRQVGGLDWGQVTALRKAMSKSLGAEFFDQFGKPWKEGAISKGVAPEVADKVWDELCAYGSWSFNKSHSVAYGIISYMCCWLKAHYPFEFAAATLTHEKNPEKQLLLLREMAVEGYDYVPVDAHASVDRWSTGWRNGKRVLVGPLQNVSGIGPKLVAQIVSARARGEKLSDRAMKLLANPKTSIDSLFPIKDAFRRVMPDPSERSIFTPPSPIASIQPTSEEQTVLVFCVLTKINPRDENEPVLVAKRGYTIKDGKTARLNLMLTDDTGTIFGMVDRWKYEALGRPIVDRGRVMKALYAIKGRVRANTDFRMISIQAVRYIGDVSDA